ncbi:bcl-2-like protein 12 [Gastrophryne carolinensis]
MDASVSAGTDGISLIKVKEETKCVLEAFLKRSLSQEEGSRLGHVGRVYHDPKKYSHRTSQEEIKDGIPKKSKKFERRRTHEFGKEKDERNHSHPFPEESTYGGSRRRWSSLHEEINRVEEKKHGFKTNIKKLLRRNSQSKEKAKDRNGSVYSKSRGSVDSVLEDHGSNKGDSMKRPKSPNPLLACTLASSTISLPGGDYKQNDPAPHEKKKASLPFSFKKLLKKKTPKENVGETNAKPARPDFLPVTPCFAAEHLPHGNTGKLVDSEIYMLAAKKLDSLIKHKKVKSPVAPPIPVEPSCPPPKNNNVPNSEKTDAEDKEEVIRKLVALLQEQAVVINEKINRDPFLRNALYRMSYGSFFRLAEIFTSQAEVEPSPTVPNMSPELTKIALTMELTRKVAGINSHAVHQLMGYSLQYMDMFVPWLQKQGGWENIVSQEDISDMQID